MLLHVLNLPKELLHSPILSMTSDDTVFEPTCDSEDHMYPWLPEYISTQCCQNANSAIL